MKDSDLGLSIGGSEHDSLLARPPENIQSGISPLKMTISVTICPPISPFLLGLEVGCADLPLILSPQPSVTGECRNYTRLCNQQKNILKSDIKITRKPWITAKLLHGHGLSDKT